MSVREHTPVKDDLQVFVGILALLALSWGAAPSFRAPARVVCAQPPNVLCAVSGALQWSPEGSLAPSAAAETLPGWVGLLLGVPLDLNRASLADLDALPGVGPRTAEAIVRRRDEARGFSTVDDLAAVRGVGPKTLERLRPWVGVRGRS